ncbi:MAG: hypothetical protein IPF53_09275 [Blastocatellia bacterium]|nr:hypothetical protein [Blastocatellia bacterium]
MIAKRDLYEARFRALIEQGLSRRFASVDAKLAALAILGALNASTRWYKPGGERSPQAIGEHFAALFLDGLRLPEPATSNLRRIR